MFIACLIANSLLYAIINSSTQGLVEASLSTSGNSLQEGKATLLVLAGPLLNAYTWFLSINYISEAEDDLFLKAKQPPSKATRKNFVRWFPVLPGLVLIPLTLWLYTSQISFLWNESKPMYLQLGILLGIFIMIIGLIVAPKFVPNLIRDLRVKKT
jgi:hypothetical protein